MHVSLKTLWPVILGVVLLIPFGILFTIATGGQVLNILGLENNWDQDMGNLIANHIQLATFMMFVAPAIAVALGIIAIVYFARMQQMREHTIEIVGSAGVIIIGLGILVLLFGHDVIPCFLHGIVRQDFQNFKSLIEICRNA